MNTRHTVDMRRTLRAFSMLEIIMSLVIASLGLVSVAAMYSTGLDMNRGSVNELVALETADQFLKYNVNKIRGDWDWTNLFANQKPGTVEPDFNHGWAEDAVFAIGDVRIRPESSMNVLDNDNSGFFLVEKGSDVNGGSEMLAVIRLWKEVEGRRDCSKTATLHCEISWSALVDYDAPARHKVIVSRDVFKAPYVGIQTTTGMKRINGNAYETTLTNIVENDDDDSYTVTFVVSHSCFCEPETSYQNKFYFGGEEIGMSNISVTGTVAVVDEHLNLSNPYHHGFEITEIPVGKDFNVPGSFMVSYTMSELEDQKISVYDADKDVHHVAEFDEDDFENFIDGTWTNSDGVEVAGNH